MKNFPPGTRFNPTDRVLSRYLYKMVEKEQSSFITTMDVYKDEPWLLDHVTDPVFKKRQWYYFVSRNNLHGNIARRTVPGRGGSEGGFWKSTDTKRKILNQRNKVIGYKQCLSYQKKVHGKPVNTDWNMTEYSLPKGKVFQDLVLCWIRQKEVKEINNGIVHHVPQPQPQPQVQAQAQVVENINNILSNQPAQEEPELTAEELEEMLLEGQEKADEELRESEEMLLQDDEELREFEENINHILPNQPMHEESGLTAEELEEMLLEGQEKADEDLRESEEMLDAMQIEGQEEADPSKEELIKFANSVLQDYPDGNDNTF